MRNPVAEYCANPLQEHHVGASPRVLLGHVDHLLSEAEGQIGKNMHAAGQAHGFVNEVYGDLERLRRKIWEWQNYAWKRR